MHVDSHHTYGMPRVRAELIDQGEAVSRKRIARLLRAHGIRGISRRRGFTVTTRRDSMQRPAPIWSSASSKRTAPISSGWPT